jgi:glycosyltransferase involved in cell wall biosynthesis
VQPRQLIDAPRLAPVLRAAIGVQGRFNAFDLAKALLKHRNDVTVFTNYPRWATQRFGLAGAHVRSLPAHGLLMKAASALPGGWSWVPDRPFHTTFGRWLARRLHESEWDVTQLWSGVAEEHLSTPRTARLRTVMRESAHIREQVTILKDERERLGVSVDLPGRWRIEREEREYAMADCVFVSSSFARDSFLRAGLPPERLALVEFGADVGAFGPRSKDVDERCRRLQSGQPIRVLNVGAASVRKGTWDFGQVARGLPRFEFRCVGDIEPVARSLASALVGRVEFTGRVPQSTLNEHYRWADVFVFPTLEDGFAAVLAQAAAAGLPIVATTNCCAPDLLAGRPASWIVPIRRPDLIIEQLEWCDVNRDELAGAAAELPRLFKPRSWSDAAADFEWQVRARLN